MFYNAAYVHFGLQPGFCQLVMLTFICLAIAALI